MTEKNEGIGLTPEEIENLQHVLLYGDLEYRVFRAVYESLKRFKMLKILKTGQEGQGDLDLEEMNASIDRQIGEFEEIMGRMRADMEKAQRLKNEGAITLPLEPDVLEKRQMLERQLRQNEIMVDVYQREIDMILNRA